jgi:hypothetical protein
MIGYSLVYFTDVGTGTGKTFTAGTFDLQVVDRDNGLGMKTKQYP